MWGKCAWVRKPAVVPLCACLLLVCACKQAESDLPIHWLASPIQIDGRFNDWDSLATSRMHEDHAVLKLANDSQNLYLYYITDDLDWVRTIKMTGLTLYFNRSGKKDKEFFVRYRNGPPIEELEQREGGPGTASSARLHPAMHEQLLESERDFHVQFTCFVRDWIVEKSIPVDGRQGPQAAYGQNAGKAAYEFCIPLKQCEPLFYGLGIAPGAVIGIGAEWGGLPRPVLEETPPGSTDFGGTRGQGTSLGDFGSAGEGSGPPEGGSPQGLPEKQEIWFKTRLATPPATGS
jgi:hypothetical protein